jgi:putative flippase GtrA
MITSTRSRPSVFAALSRVVPKNRVMRFLIVGGWNTAFGLILYGVVVHIFTRSLPPRLNWLIADLSHIISMPIAITMAFLCYKHFVFQTKGDYVREWGRCLAVYSVSFVIGLVVLPGATQLLSKFSYTNHYAVYAAGLVNSAVIATYSYFGHKKFSFKR